MLPKEPKKALVLSGGGGRGAYHVGALRALQDNEWFPDIVVGTSIGAVNGAAIASGHDARSLWRLWKKLLNDDVQRGAFQGDFGILEGRYIYNTAPLRETLGNGEWIDFKRLNSNEAKAHLRITATEIETGNLHVFGNSQDVIESRMRVEPITLDHIIASCSIPLVYPATRLHGRYFWDGATVSNTPLGAAIDAGAEEIIVVLMTPWVEDKAPVKLPDSALEAIGLTLDWALLASFRSDMKLFRRVNDLVQLTEENRRLREALEEMTRRMGDADFADTYADLNKDNYPDIFEKKLRRLPSPVVIAPERPISITQIVSYTAEGHQEMYDAGYQDAISAWPEIEALRRG